MRRDAACFFIYRMRFSPNSLSFEHTRLATKRGFAAGIKTLTSRKKDVCPWHLSRLSPRRPGLPTPPPQRFYGWCQGVRVKAPPPPPTVNVCACGAARRRGKGVPRALDDAKQPPPGAEDNHLFPPKPSADGVQAGRQAAAAPQPQPP